MRLGFAIVSYVYNAERLAIANRSFNSLAKTNVQGLVRPVLQIMYNPKSLLMYGDVFDVLTPAWEVYTDADTTVGFNALVSAAGDHLIKEHEDITHIGFLWDDFVYNSEWLQELNSLIKRHPEAKAWSIYRSSYTRHHRIIGGDKTDVLMTMHDGIGTMTREEWIEYGASQRTDFTCPESMGGGCTIDIHHAYERSGERWATSRDYCENLGVHSFLGRQDQAIDFVGE